MINKTLAQLFENFPTINQFPEGVVTGIAVDSRVVKPGDLFVATSDRSDGHDYICLAIEQGAVAVMGTKPLNKLSIPYVQVADAREAMAHISSVFYNHPADQLTLIGVTGTDGKTTTVNYIYQILKEAGIKAGMISTVNAVIDDQEMDTGLHVTSPEVFDLQRYLRQMVDAGLTHAVLETTSHGLAARRVLGKVFDIGVITNITHEHLDYHGSYKEYFSAKAKLFEGLSEKKPTDEVKPLAVLNLDDRSYKDLSNLAKVNQVNYGFDPKAEIRASEVVNTPDYLRFKIQTPDLEIPIETSLIGNYNVSNCLAAFSATVVGLGIKPEVAQAGIKALSGVPGRMERISLGQEFLVLVDFAHTPFALEAVLKAGKKLTEGRVIAVFGSAGLRDKEKRRMMAEVSAELADLTILTAEDPRTESLESILEEMADGAVKRGGVEGETFYRIPDRGEALRFAVNQAQPGDIVLALGKGHEQSMCFGETEYPWDDREATQAALSEFLNIEGPQMPYLPTG